jgi:hypothetical protein
MNANTPTHGWKIHLNCGGESTALADDVVRYLEANAIHHKRGQSSGQSGKDITVYVGAFDAAVEMGRSLRKNFPKLLHGAGDALADDIILENPRILVRFDARLPGWHQYGFAGVPLPNDDVMRINDSFGNALDLSAKQGIIENAQRMLTETFGAFYCGKQHRALFEDCRYQVLARLAQRQDTKRASALATASIK